MVDSLTYEVSFPRLASDISTRGRQFNMGGLVSSASLRHSTCGRQFNMGGLVSSASLRH